MFPILLVLVLLLCALYAYGLWLCRDRGGDS